MVTMYLRHSLDERLRITIFRALNLPRRSTGDIYEQVAGQCRRRATSSTSRSVEKRKLTRRTGDGCTLAQRVEHAETS